jgi:hypothetical protein
MDMNFSLNGYDIFLNPIYAFGNIYQTKVQNALLVDKKGLKIYTKMHGIGNDKNVKEAWKYLKKQTKYYQYMVIRMMKWQAGLAEGIITPDNFEMMINTFMEENNKSGLTIKDTW